MARVFLAGTMQGGNPGVDIHDQAYRSEIRTILQRVSPTMEIFDPSGEVQRLLAKDDVRRAITSVASNGPSVLRLEDLPRPIQEVRTAFLRMTEESRRCSLCIAYLPDRIPSMGTAMEMYAAQSAGVPIVAVTDMVSNLAIAAVSTWIVPDLAALAELLLSGELPGIGTSATESDAGRSGA